MTTPFNLSIKSVCDQRIRQMLYNKPPSRINLVSPYETTPYTKFDLDMRRKAEVLKHQTGNTKGNTLTKKQKWTQIAQGNYQTIPASYQNSVTIRDTSSSSVRILDCASTSIIRTPLSSCDVPPDPNVSYLYYDADVPLYNYLNPISTRAYGFENIQPNDDAMFKTIVNYNTPCIMNTPTKIASILFLENADQKTYTINIQNIPIGIYVNGDFSGNSINKSNSININNIQLDAYYNDILVPKRSVYQETYNPSNIIQPYTLDFSVNTIISGKTFKGMYYIGNISISNILLYINPGFIYDFKLNVDYTYSSNINSNVPSINTSIIANITPEQIYSNNCSVTPNNGNLSIPSMTIS
jgi:hypothetical protein